MNLNQDGSDERTSSSSGRPGASNELAQPLPCVISFRLLDSKDGPITSRLAPFAKSYNEAILYALGSFPKHLPPRTSKSAISLKYPCKALDGTVYWSDLQVARESSEIWMRLMTEAGRIPEIGVTIEGEASVAQLDSEPLTTKDGVLIRLGVFDKTNPQWIVTARPTPTRPPQTYQECLEFVAQRLEASFPSNSKNQRQQGTNWRALLRLRVWDPVLRVPTSLNENNYREKLQSCAFNDYGKESSEEDYVEIHAHYD